MFSSDVRNQWLAAICVNILSLGIGTIAGWPAANLLVLQSKDTPLPSGPLTIEQVSWVGSLMSLGSLIGNIAFGWLSGRYGRKYPMIAAAVPQLIGWLLIMFARNPMYLYVSRFLSGLAGGAIYVILPVFITEISDNKVRGTLGSVMILFSNTGVLVSFVAGYVCSYTMIPQILILFPVLFLVCMPFFPETPQFLIRCGREKDAQRAICFYRNIDWPSNGQIDLLKEEMDKLKDSAHADQNANQPIDRITWRDFASTVARKAIVIGLTLFAIKKFGGLFALVNYSGDVFTGAGSHLDPKLCAIIIGCIQLAGTYVPMFLVDRVGRKILLSGSLAGTSIGLATMGAYMYLQSIGHNLDAFNWIPLASFSFVLFIASCGFVPIPFIIVSEVMPPKIRLAGLSLCMHLFWICDFIMNKCYPIMAVTFGMHVCFFIFAGVTCFGALFVVFMVPETRGKSLDEIMQIMKN